MCLLERGAARLCSDCIIRIKPPEDFRFTVAATGAPLRGFVASASAARLRTAANLTGCNGEGIGLLEKRVGCTLPEVKQENGLSVVAGGPKGASRCRDYPRLNVRARSFAP